MPDVELRIESAGRADFSDRGVRSAADGGQGTAHQGVDAAEAAALHARVIVRDLGGELPAKLRGALRRRAAASQDTKKPAS